MAWVWTKVTGLAWVWEEAWAFWLVLPYQIKVTGLAWAWEEV
jgi:hypothetical protein